MSAKARHLLIKHYRTDCQIAFATEVKHKEKFLDELENLLMGPFQYKITTDLPTYDRVFKYKGTSFGGINKVRLFDWLAKKGWVMVGSFGDKFAEEYIYTKGSSTNSGQRAASAMTVTTNLDDDDW